MANFLSDKALRGPLGTRRQPQFEDLVPHVRLQEQPLVQLPEDPRRWEISPFLWQLQDLGTQNAEAQAQVVYDQNLEAEVRQQAQRHGVQADMIEELLRRHDVLAHDAYEALSRNSYESNFDEPLDHGALVAALAPLAQGPAALGRRPPPEPIAAALAPLLGASPADLQAAAHRMQPPLPPPPGTPPPIEEPPEARPAPGAQRGVPPGVPPVPKMFRMDTPGSTPMPTPRYLKEAKAMTSELAQQHRQLQHGLAVAAVTQHLEQAQDLVAAQTTSQLTGAAAAASVAPSHELQVQRLAHVVLAQSVAPNPMLEVLRARFADLDQELTERVAILTEARASSSSTEDDAIGRTREKIRLLRAEMADVARRIREHVDDFHATGPGLSQQLVQQAIITGAVENLAAATAAQEDPEIMPAPELPAVIPGPVPKPPPVAPALGADPNAFPEGWPPDESWRFNPGEMDPLEMAFGTFWLQLSRPERDNLRELARTHHGELFRVLGDAMVRETLWPDSALRAPLTRNMARELLRQSLQEAVDPRNSALRGQLIHNIAVYLRAMELDRQALLAGHQPKSTMAVPKPPPYTWGEYAEDMLHGTLDAGREVLRNTPAMGRAAYANILRPAGRMGWRAAGGAADALRPLADRLADRVLGPAGDAWDLGPPPTPRGPIAGSTAKPPPTTAKWRGAEEAIRAQTAKAWAPRPSAASGSWGQGAWVAPPAQHPPPRPTRRPQSKSPPVPGAASKSRRPKPSVIGASSKSTGGPPRP